MSAISKQDRLTGALIGLARATDGNEHLIRPSSTAVIVNCLSAMLTEDFPPEILLEQVEQEKRKMVPDCFLCANPCGKNSDYDLRQLQNTPEEVRDLKYLLLHGSRSLALCAQQAARLGHHDDAVDRFFYKVLILIGMEGWEADALLPFVAEMGEMAQRCTALLTAKNDAIF